MPAITGPVQIINVGGGVLQFGDSLVTSPKSAAKTIAGSGSVNSGGLILTINGINGSNVLDVNGIDQPITGNN
ncbi:spore germination protein [Bacillus sp. MUM 13]|uniref:spore germination protein n=1 Tax=Bacillus sp. MUM 13 TaxID=1678001 RepID=UPI0008F5B154|nr:spore germination protein [Bacillus sp. MUM 13]OIK14085.1 hypothetical protein BIV59_03845 [Bacillus sp. MUM 13]